MWKILGKEVLYLDIAPTWKDRMIELSSGSEGAERFKELMDAAEVTYMLNGTTEMNSFMMEFSEDVTPEDLQFLADMTLKIANDNLDTPFIAIDDEYQQCQVVYTSEKEPELIGANKTEGFNSGKIFMPIFEAFSKPGRQNESLL